MGSGQGHDGLRHLAAGATDAADRARDRRGARNSCSSRTRRRRPIPPGSANKPSGNWWKFGFPVFYVTDLLQNVEALIALGYGDDPRLQNALALIRDKQDEQGRWSLDYDYTGKTWVDFGPKRQFNKWVTQRVIRVLSRAAG